MPKEAAVKSFKQVLSGTCSAEWEQCGGKDWTGATCCAAGNNCNVVNEWYSQCIKDPNAQTNPDASCTVDDWAQCCGQSHAGSTCCKSIDYEC
eukprot:1291828-Rhodomonas_salina.1